MRMLSHSSVGVVLSTCFPFPFKSLLILNTYLAINLRRVFLVCSRCLDIVRARACVRVRACACGWQLQPSPLLLSHVMLTHALLPPSASPVGEAGGSLDSPSSYSLRRGNETAFCVSVYAWFYAPVLPFLFTPLGGGDGQ